ncbi:unnamed protein product [Darwinula stevensoni]|uniref:Ig-like domain-containing protein n=1 Tax=Darwinula stevensoni TaxID=69355 RepID=A0A7R8X514_9CRUS|nr:unnamed protein product [Darwinula stevensoni]CAG0879942.1 unnamed protein product [Darwinula stevensoni]
MEHGTSLSLFYFPGQEWGLVISNVEEEDAGIYGCHIPTYPPTSIFIQLHVTRTVAEISGGREIHVKSGSSLRLHCRFIGGHPSYVFWYKGSDMINHDSKVSVGLDDEGSLMVLSNVDTNDSGNFTCEPSTGQPASITVHVLNAGENPAAAMRQRASLICRPRSSISLLVLAIHFLIPRLVFPVPANHGSSASFSRNPGKEREDAEKRILLA